MSNMADAPEARGIGLAAVENAGGVELPAPVEPEILVETQADDLRLTDFFARRLWLAALAPLVFVAVTSYFTAVRVADAVSPLGRGLVYEDKFFQSPLIPIFARHLLPFGLSMGVESGYGYSLSYVLQTNLIVGAVALLIGCLLVVAATRRSSDAIYVAGPYFVYSLIAVSLLHAGGKYFTTLGDLFPALLGALLAPLLIGVLAKVLAVWMRNQGWLEADAPAFESVIAESHASPSSPGAQATVGVQAATGQATPPPAVELQHVTHAVACPYCGNPKVVHDNPHACGRCHRNIGLAVEHDELRCPTCDGALVKDALHCHHCGIWLKDNDAEREPAQEELEVA